MKKSISVSFVTSILALAAFAPLMASAQSYYGQNYQQQMYGYGGGYGGSSYGYTQPYYPNYDQGAVYYHYYYPAAQPIMRPYYTLAAAPSSYGYAPSVPYSYNSGNYYNAYPSYPYNYGSSYIHY